MHKPTISSIKYLEETSLTNNWTQPVISLQKYTKLWMSKHNILKCIKKSNMFTCQIYNKEITKYNKSYVKNKNYSNKKIKQTKKLTRMWYSIKIILFI